MAFALEEQMKFFFARVLSGTVFRAAWAGLMPVGRSSLLLTPTVHSCTGAGYRLPEGRSTASELNRK